MVTIRGPRTRDFVNGLVGGQNIWTSGFRFEEGRNGFWWINDPKYDFPESYFDENQPDNAQENEYCVEMNWRVSKKFNDNQCSLQRHFVCEKNAQL